MFGRPSPSALPPPDEIEWIIAVFAWLLAENGGFAAFEGTEMVLPTDAFYPVARSLAGHDLALQLFEQTRRLAGMADWPCDLVPHADAPSARELLGSVPHGATGSHGALGTFRAAMRGGKVRGVMTYSPGSLADPAGFIATMAHELGHYLMAGAASDPPGGAEAEEPATDLAAIFLGFGIFTANSAFSFRQFQDGNTQGWERQTRGYLDQRSLAYGLALFCRLLEIDPRIARSHLEANPRGYLKHALVDLDRHRRDDLQALSAIAGAP
jgi:hypothetical protein